MLHAKILQFPGDHEIWAGEDAIQQQQPQYTPAAFIFGELRFVASRTVVLSIIKNWMFE